MTLPSETTLTAVIQAAHAGEQEVVNALLSEPPKEGLNETTRWREIMRWAIQQKDLPLFQSVFAAVQQHAIRWDDCNLIALKCACQVEDIEIVNYLWPYTDDLRKIVAFEWAAGQGKLDVIRALKKLGGYEKNIAFFNRGLTAMNNAVRGKHWDVFDELLDFQDAPTDLLRMVVRDKQCDHEMLHGLIQYYSDKDVAWVMQHQSGSLGGKILHDVVQARDHKRALEDAMGELGEQGSAENTPSKARKI